MNTCTYSYLYNDYNLQTIDGEDVSQLNLSWLRSQLGIVAQEPTLFEDTIRNNIAYGDQARDVPLEEVMAAARQANIHQFVTSLPLVSSRIYYQMSKGPIMPCVVSLVYLLKKKKSCFLVFSLAFWIPTCWYPKHE